MGDIAKNVTVNSGSAKVCRRSVLRGTLPVVRHSLPITGRVVLAGALLISAFGLSGCGYGDVEFKGKIFDAVGINGTQNKKKVRLAPRTGLVTPPSLERLPEPGSAGSSGGDGLASINDPDRRQVESAQELAVRQAAYCKKHYEPLVLRGDASAETIEGPGGPCRRSALTAYKKWTAEPEQPAQN